MLIAVLAPAARAQICLLGVDAPSPAAAHGAGDIRETSPAPDVARWRVIEALAGGLDRGFDPRLDTPDFNNTLTVSCAPLGADGEQDWSRSRPYSAGVCVGMCLTAQVFFRQVAWPLGRDRALAEATRACFFPGERVPLPGEPLSRLREYCRAGQDRRRTQVAIEAGQAQLNGGWDASEWLPAASAAETVDSIAGEIATKGTCLLARQLTRAEDGDGWVGTGGHAIVAYAVKTGTAVLGGGAPRPVVVIKLWDPNRCWSSPGAPESEDTAQDALVFDPQAKTLSFTGDYLAFSNGTAAPDRASPSLQPAESLRTGRDLFVLRALDHRLAEVLKGAATSPDRTDVKDHPSL